MLQENKNRRQFLKHLAISTGSVVLVPYVVSCGTNPPNPDAMANEQAMKEAEAKAAAEKMDAEEQANVAKMLDANAIPPIKPEGWDPIAYNKVRGNAGAIPKSYLKDINGADGEMKHLGKHLPYVPTLDAAMVPAGFIALMWGDPEKGHVKHPNAPKTEDNPDGHWYNWIRVRKATAEEAEELQSNYTDWPGIAEGDNGAYAVFGGGEITAESGKNTVYLAALPKDVKKGDTIRIHAHCLTHGEYVDFITV